MAFVKRVLFSKTESGLFNQTAMFCAVGFSMSLAVVLSCGLRIVDTWV
jgi:hypothetical protein